MSQFARDEWVKKHLPTVSPELKISFEVMKLAYDAGYEAGQKDTRMRAAAQEREDRYGPDI